MRDNHNHTKRYCNNCAVKNRKEYKKSKQFVWDMCGDVIIDNLLKQNGYIIHYPEKVDKDEEFEFGGELFVMKEKCILEKDDISL